MFWQGTKDRLTQIEEVLRSVETKSEMTQTVLMIREPESVIAAEAFTGLRKQIAASSKHHWAHMAQLAEMDVAVNHATSLEEIQQLVSQWLSTAGLVRVTDGSAPDVEQIFDVVAEEGPVFKVLQPAYVDRATGRTIKNGRAAYTAKAPARVTQSVREREIIPAVPAAADEQDEISEEER